MRKDGERRHSIDILFLVVIFLVFTFSALSALLLAVNFYQDTIDKSENNENARAAVAYIREVVHQNDKKGAVSIEPFDGTTCMKIRQEGDYLLYLYLKGGELRELYTKKGAKVSTADGQRIMKLKELEFETAAKDCYRILCTDSTGNTETILISIKTAGGRGR